MNKMIQHLRHTVMWIELNSCWPHIVNTASFLSICPNKRKKTYTASKELTCLSNLPGLVKAGSRMSGKFVAAINMIPCRKVKLNSTPRWIRNLTFAHQLLWCTSFCSKPSISTSSWCNVFFVWPSHCFLVDPTASISSINMMQGACERLGQDKYFNTVIYLFINFQKKIHAPLSD